MSMRTTYPYDEALNDLELFFKSHIKDPDTLAELLSYLEECRIEKTVTFRYIHERLMQYRKDFSDYFGYSVDEQAMIEDLLYFWA